MQWMCNVAWKIEERMATPENIASLGALLFDDSMIRELHVLHFCDCYSSHWRNNHSRIAVCTVRPPNPIAVDARLLEEKISLIVSKAELYIHIDCSSKVKLILLGINNTSQIQAVAPQKLAHSSQLVTSPFSSFVPSPSTIFSISS